MFTLNCKGRLIVAERPLVMGIINITPDSFYDGGKFGDEKEMLIQAERLSLGGIFLSWDH